MLSVHTAAEALTRGGDVLLMDADVLYDERILDALVANPHAHVNRLLIDRDFETGDEPVKLCVERRRAGRVAQASRRADCTTTRSANRSASSASTNTRRSGSRKSSRIMSRRAARTCRMKKRCAICCSKSSHVFDVADVTGAPWIEIDFQNDVTRAADEVLPQLNQLAGALR